MSELSNRIFSNTPRFFKKVRTFSIAIGSLSTLIVTSGLAIPSSFLFLIGQAGIVAGIVGAFIASLSIEKDDSELKK